MPLEEYARKRTFAKTPEPEPKVVTEPGGGDFFCVQRHHATRLHYDFRLEAGGVLVSWAVPKGPTLDPKEKRLAMHVEDHPLDYGNFEGNIPKGNYGAGSVMLWDRGRYDMAGDKSAPQQLERGDFKFRLYGSKLRGEFAIVRMKNRGKGDEWLLLKKKDEYAVPGWDVEAHAVSVITGRTQQEIASGIPAAGPEPLRPAQAGGDAFPESITPMKAEIGSTLPRGDGWLYEIKWDGVRAICFVDAGKLRMASRNGNPCDRQYPELSILPRCLKASRAVLDGEIVVLDDKGIPSFSLIQPRIMASDPNTIANMARARSATLFLFDLLYLDGRDLRALPLTERRRLLESIVQPTPSIRVSDTFSDGKALFEAAKEQGLEGIVAKRADSSYEPRRTPQWVKFKTTRQQEFVICGFTHGEREHFGALVLGLYENGKLVYVGNAGTGFTGKIMADLARRLEPLVTESSPFPDPPKMARGSVVWVRPELVCQVKYGSWTHEKHLRAPVYLGLRLDVEPKDCVSEEAKAAEPAPVEKPPLLSAERKEVILDIDGRRLKFTNLDKIFYPRDGYNKRDIINYYDAVAPLIVPHLAGRPLSLKRYPNGIDGGHFFQKDSPESFPSWLRFENIFSEHNQAPIRYVLAADRASLLYLAQLGCIDQNPWMSRAGSLEAPDFVLIDLDPVECPYEMIVEAAQLVRKKLDLVGLQGFPKTTGGDGMHVYIPVAPEYTYEQTRTFAELLGALCLHDRPDLFTTPRSVKRREKNRVYFDHLQNRQGSTIAAAYVLRAHDAAPVSTPLEWKEVVRGLSPKQFHIRNAPDRFARLGDLFAPVLTLHQRIEPALEKLAGALA
ncbi:MAG: DNA ligase D [Bryobacteraceae bacterium]